MPFLIDASVYEDHERNVMNLGETKNWGLKADILSKGWYNAPNDESENPNSIEKICVKKQQKYAPKSLAPFVSRAIGLTESGISYLFLIPVFVQSCGLW